jgi:hypothetical protein
MCVQGSVEEQQTGREQREQVEKSTINAIRTHLEAQGKPPENEIEKSRRRWCVLGASLRDGLREQ